MVVDTDMTLQQPESGGAILAYDGHTVTLAPTLTVHIGSPEAAPRYA
jgi:hypothetical protein